MEAQLIQFSTVVVGKVHNPTILNPDFLRANAIVPEDWGWEVAETMTTPPFAVVRYTSGISVAVELNKLQVTDIDAGDSPTRSKVAEIATSYVRILPHVLYTAVGINFQSVLEMESPEGYLKNRFVKPGPWHSSKRMLSAAGVRLVYLLGNEGRFTLSFDSGEAQERGQKNRKKVLIANGNFHRDCDMHPGHEQVAKHLTNVTSDWSIYREVLTEALAD